MAFGVLERRETTTGLKRFYFTAGAIPADCHHIKRNLMSYLDKTFCASPNCKNDCGRRMTDEEHQRLIYLNTDRVSYGYFCGEPVDINSSKNSATEDIFDAEL